MTRITIFIFFIVFYRICWKHVFSCYIALIILNKTCINKLNRTMLFVTYAYLRTFKYTSCMSTRPTFHSLKFLCVYWHLIFTFSTILSFRILFMSINYKRIDVECKTYIKFGMFLSMFINYFYTLCYVNWYCIIDIEIQIEHYLMLVKYFISS